MADLTKSVTKAAPLHQAITMRVQANASGSLLDAVTINTSGKAVKSADGSGKACYIVVAAAKHTAAGTYAADEWLTVVAFGPVTGFTGLTPGKLAYLAATAGVLADSGTVPVGYAVDDTTLFWMPGIANAAS